MHTDGEILMPLISVQCVNTLNHDSFTVSVGDSTRNTFLSLFLALTRVVFLLKNWSLNSGLQNICSENKHSSVLEHLL